MDLDSTSTSETPSSIEPNAVSNSESSNSEITYLKDIIEQGDIVGAQRVPERQTFRDLLSQRGPEVINELSPLLNSKRLYRRAECAASCSEILKAIATETDPGDAFITFLEQLDEECSTDKVIILLPPLRILLQRLGESRRCWLEWTLITVKSCLDELAAPEDHEAVMDNKIILKEDPYVDSIVALYGALVSFLGSFAECCLTQKEKYALVLFGFEILAQPTMYVYDAVFDKIMEFHCENIVIINERLSVDVYRYLNDLDDKCLLDAEKDEVKSLKEDSEECIPTCERISPLNLALYYSAFIREQPFLQYFPQVYERFYLFQKLMYLCVVLLNHSHNAVVQKGLSLSSVLISSMNCGSIPGACLEGRVHKEFIKIISSISVYSYILENRRDAIRLLLPYIYLFDAQGVYNLLLNISSIMDSPNVDGEVITSLRNRWLKSANEDKYEFYQKGKYLIDLLKRFCAIPKFSKSAMLKYKDKILATLNLFALLLKRDVNGVTGLDRHFEYFERTYFSAVVKAVKESRCSFLKDLQNLRQGVRSRPETEEIEQDIIVEGRPLPRLTPNEKIDALQRALLDLDMINQSMELVYTYANRDISALK